MKIAKKLIIMAIVSIFIAYTSSQLLNLSAKRIIKMTMLLQTITKKISPTIDTINNHSLGLGFLSRIPNAPAHAKVKTDQTLKIVF